jgi:hypothetical protein
MAGAQARSRVSMKILMEEDQVPPVRIGLEPLAPAVHGAAAVALQEDRRQPPRQFRGDFPQVHHLPRARRAFHFEVVAEIEVKLLEGFDQQVVRREPHRAAPVRVAAEQPVGRFPGLVVDEVVLAVELKHEGMILVRARERADTVRREELTLVEHGGEDAAQLPRIRDGQETAFSHARILHRRDVAGQILAIREEPLHAGPEVLHLG